MIMHVKKRYDVLFVFNCLKSTTAPQLFVDLCCVLWTLSVVVNLLLSLTGKPLVLIEIQFLNVVFCSLSFGKPSFFPIGSHLNRCPL